MNTRQNAIWQVPDEEPDISGDRPGRSDYDLDRFRILRRQVADAANRQGWTQAEVARRIQIAGSTFSQWYSGGYNGRLDETNKKIAIWIEMMEETGAFSRPLIDIPGFVMTRTAKEFSGTLDIAQALGCFVIITSGAGMGKTLTFEHHVKNRPHAYLATMRPHTRTVHGMLVDVAASLGITQHNPAQLDRTIGTFLARGADTLLIIDEAQNLIDQAVDQLRYFSDIYKIGVALGGNMEVYGRFSARADGPSYAQIKRRVFKRIKRVRPYKEDIDAILAAWKINDEGMARFLTGLAYKDGALGAMCQTLKFAKIMAQGAGEDLTLDYLKAAQDEREMDGV